MTYIEKFQAEAEQISDQESIIELINRISIVLQEIKNPVALLKIRASLWIKLDKKTKAVNDFLKITQLEPEDKEALAQLHLLQTIIRYNNSDIYANTNTNMDPWLE